MRHLVWDSSLSCKDVYQDSKFKSVKSRVADEVLVAPLLFPTPKPSLYGLKSPMPHVSAPLSLTRWILRTEDRFSQPKNHHPPEHPKPGHVIRTVERFLCLNNKTTYLSAQSLDAGQNHLHVAALVQVWGLEHTHTVHAVRLAEVHESLDVLQLQRDRKRVIEHLVANSRANLASTYSCQSHFIILECG